MQIDHLKAVLEALGGKEGADGWVEAPEGRTIALHVAHAGAALAVGKAIAVRLAGDLIHARTQRGELFVVLREDVFAAAIDGSTSAGRKAGFL